VSNAIVLHFFANLNPVRADANTATLAAYTAALRSCAGRGAGDVGAVIADDPLAPCTGSCANSYRQVLRLVEDDNWQAALRQTLVAYVSQVEGDSVDTLDVDLPFYTRYSVKVLASRTNDYATAFGVPWQLTSMYYPWNRTFEIGLFANDTTTASDAHPSTAASTRRGS